MAEVDAHVKMTVVPIRMMFAAPLTSSVHFGYVMIHLAAMFTMAGYIAVNSCSVGLESLAAIVLPVPIRSSGRSACGHQ